MLGFDPVQAFNLILERLDRIAAALEELAAEAKKKAQAAK